MMDEIEKIHESPYVMLIPLFILAAGSIFAGIIFKDLFIGYNKDIFWSDSIKFLIPLSTEHPPALIVYSTPILGPSKASAFIFAVPFLSIITENIFLNEIITMNTIIGGILGLIAIYIVNKK